nr:ABC transporter substrate-binding protein [Microbacterium bovistercoris]
MITKRFAIPVAVVATALTLAACSSGPGGSGGASGSTGDYKIGVLVSQTGGAAQLGSGELQGAQLAADTINANGGIDGHQITLVPLDDKTTPDQALQQAKSLLQQGVVAVVGPSVVADCNAVAPLFANGPIDYCLSPAINPSGYVWSSSVAQDAFMQTGMSYWKSQGITKIAIVSSTDASGTSGAASTQAAAAQVGIQVTAAVTFDPTSVSVTPQIQQAVASNPQAIVVFSTGTPAGVALKGVQELGIKLPIMTTDGNLTYSFLNSIKDYTPDTLLIPATRDFWGQNVAVSDEVTKLETDYHQQFQQRFNAKPDFGPGVAYDAVSLIAEAIKSAGSTDPAALKTALEGIQGYEGVVGQYNFSADDHRGIDAKSIRLVQVKDGDFAYVDGQ